MRVLALDTSTAWCSVAVGDGQQWHRLDEEAQQANSERVLPMVQRALAESGWALSALDGIAFGAGPGSFTGVRIGCGVAQGLALGADLPVLPVGTLAALAQEAHRARGWRSVIACLDARMHEVYVAAYTRLGDLWEESLPPSVLPPKDVRRPLPTDARWCGAGDGFAVYPALASELALADVAADSRPTAQAIGELALPRLAAGEGLAAADAAPMYVRQRVALTAVEQARGERL
jgi:tRNA threonylcarbamoyladenosine biosynthesis protein TsaB